MEKNYINWQGDTHFYIDIREKEYGVRVSVEDTPKASEIVKKVLEERKKQIEAWKQKWIGGTVQCI